jgi:hypothetical protein
MALTAFQREVCRLLADTRIRSHLDLVHDTAEALEAAWRADCASLEAAGCRVRVLRERAGLVEVGVDRGEDSVVIQWTRDSAYRFFPLVRHEDLGLTLHAFDLATNKLLALVGRGEPRDLVDALACHVGVQPLGYLAWAACGKDPGFSPRAILEHAAGSTRYAAAEMAGLAFEGPPPDPADLLRRWWEAFTSAREIVSLLPPEQAGKAVLSREAELFRGDAAQLGEALAAKALLFHEGAIKGAFPQMVR